MLRQLAGHCRCGPAGAGCLRRRCSVECSVRRPPTCTWARSTALVAICQAMVLVPGAHILNGALDLLDLRVTLGLARLGFAALLLTAISGGLMIGLALGGQTLAVTAPSSSAPFYRRRNRRGGRRRVIPGVLLDAVADDRLAGGGRHVGARGALVGAGAWALSLAVAAFAVLPAGRVDPGARSRITCASRSPRVGFASVVALVPGLFVFRTLSGLAQFADAPSPALLSAAASNLIVAIHHRWQAWRLGWRCRCMCSPACGGDGTSSERPPYPYVMSVKVDLDQLAGALADFTFAYLITVGDDYHAHTVAVEPVLADGVLDVGTIGNEHAEEPRRARRRHARLAAARARRLLADRRRQRPTHGRRHADVVPSRAVLHRKAAPGTRPNPAAKTTACHSK